MKTSTHVLAALLIAFAGTAAAAGEIPRYEPRYGLDLGGNTYRVPSYTAPSYSAPSYTSPKRAAPYFPPSESLLGPDYTYPQEPNLGDPRSYRNTDPRTCTGLLCD